MRKEHRRLTRRNMKVFFSTQNIDPGLFGQKEGLHLSIPTGVGIARIATSGRGVGAGGIHQISSLVPRVKTKKESGAVLDRGCLYMAFSVQGKAWPFHPRGWLCRQSSWVYGMPVHYVVPVQEAWYCLCFGLLHSWKLASPAVVACV